jgi:hypothetical protein
MKTLLNFIKNGFKDLGYAYYEHIYFHEGSYFAGYVVVYEYKFFWITSQKRVAICLDKEELNSVLNLLKNK